MVDIRCQPLWGTPFLALWVGDKDMVKKLMKRCLERGIAELKNKAPSSLAQLAKYMVSKPDKPDFDKYRRAAVPTCAGLIHGATSEPPTPAQLELD